MYELIIYGEASQKIVKRLPFESSQFTYNLMDFLRENQLPIASSCLGEGICKKCVINEKTLSCTLSLGDFRKTAPQPADTRCDSNSYLVSIGYL